MEKGFVFWKPSWLSDSYRLGPKATDGAGSGPKSSNAGSGWGCSAYCSCRELSSSFPAQGVPTCWVAATLRACWVPAAASVHKVIPKIWPHSGVVPAIWMKYEHC